MDIRSDTREPFRIPELSKRNWDGLLVVFCGVDGSGKSSVLKEIARYLAGEGYTVYETFQPSRYIRNSEVFRLGHSDKVDQIDYRALLLLTVGDRLHHCTYEILPRLRRGEVVMCDRYIYSTLANMIVNNRSDEEWLYSVARDIPKPDFTFFLDVDAELAISRIKSRPDERFSVDEEYIGNMVGAYRMIQKKAEMISIDSSAEINRAVEQIKSKMMPLDSKYPNLKR